MKRFVTFTLSTFALLCLLALAPSGAATALAGEGTTSSMAFAKGEAQSNQVDLNSASLEELRMLPGIGRAYSKKIVEHRPYKSVEELRTRKVLPQGTYRKIRDKVIANGR